MGSSEPAGASWCVEAWHGAVWCGTHLAAASSRSLMLNSPDRSNSMWSGSTNTCTEKPYLQRQEVAVAVAGACRGVQGW